MGERVSYAGGCELGEYLRLHGGALGGNAWKMDDRVGGGLVC